MPENRKTDKEKHTTIGKLMKIKQNYWRVGFVMAALTLLSLAFPAMAGEQVPFEGVEVGADTAGPFDFPFASILDTSEGEATHLGHFTKTGIIRIDVTSETGIGAVTGTFTLTAANGDVLFLTGAGDAPPPSEHPVTLFHVTVMGGTGRFEGATGSWTEVSHFANAFTPGVGTDPYVAELVGTISTTGASKH
jgi:hypothetical protein